MHHAQVVEHPQGGACEVPEFAVVALRLELRHHHHGEHHVVLGEAQDGVRVRQQDGGVQHIGAQARAPGASRLCVSSIEVTWSSSAAPPSALGVVGHSPH